MERKLYVVAADTYDEAYGARIYLLGVYDSKEKAIERLKCLKQETYLPMDDEDCIEEISVNRDTNIYLGGYVE